MDIKAGADTEAIKEEIKREFQLERMILFSDAVFAIVITLMAIEIQMPELPPHFTVTQLNKALLHLIPVVFAYTISFFFIGSLWYQHLKLFSIVKDYDLGLVTRNLGLLFFVGFFPFSASLMTKANGAPIAMFIYFAIIFSCIVAQFILLKYVLLKKQHLRLNLADLNDHIKELNRKEASIWTFLLFGILIVITYNIIKVPEYKAMSTMWMTLFPFAMKLIRKRLDKKAPKSV